MENKVVVILGMMRSGTSFIASWLNACGLSLGENLKEADDILNLKGFFEDEEINALNEAIEKRSITFLRKLIVLYPIKPKLIVEDRTMAKKLITEKCLKYFQWGWKEPKCSWLWNTLWYPSIKELNLTNSLSIVIVLRDYNKVIVSCLRSTSLFNQKKFINYWHFRLFKNRYANNFLRMWILYNKEMLKFIQHNPSFKRFIIVDTSTVLESSMEVFSVLEKQLNLELFYIDPKNIYEEKLLDRPFDIKYKLNKKLVKQANEINLKFKELQEQKLITIK